MARGRALRRHHTYRVSHHRLMQRAKFWHQSPLELEQEPLRFAKVHGLGCPSCRKRYKGHPRNGGPGMCKAGVRWRHYQHRTEARRIVELARGFSNVDWESDWAVLAASPGHYNW